MSSSTEYQEPLEKESPQSTTLDHEQSPASNPAVRMRQTKTRQTTRQTTADRRTGTAPSRQRTRTKTGLSGVREVISSHLKPPKKIGATTTSKSLRAVVTASWLNVLLVCIPISWAMHFAKQSDIIIFVFSFLAIVPLAKLLGFATEELALRVGQTIGGLLNATLGNAVELIVSIIALTQCKLNIVQSSLIGSILSNILLVLGMCFFAGGIRKAEQGFLASAANLNSSLLTISVIAVLLPAAFLFAVDKSNGQSSGSTNSTNSTSSAITNGTNSTLSPRVEGDDILKMSRGVAVILLIIYLAYLVFQLWSHAHLYEDNEAFQSTNYPANLRIPHLHRQRRAEDPAEPLPSEMTVGETEAHPVQSRSSRTSDDPEALTVKSEEEEIEEPQLTVPVCIGLLILVTVLVAVTAEFLVDSIDGVTENTALSQTWVGLILLPIVGNAAEHVTAVTVSVKDKLTLSLGVAVGSSIQIALFVIPFSVILAWIMDKPLTLLFDPFQSIVLFLAVLTVNYCVQDGKSNWLEGMILMCLYLIIAVSVWFYPMVDITNGLPSLQCPPM